MSFFRDIENFFDDLKDRFRGENEDRRREDRDLELAIEENELGTSNEVVAKKLKILNVDLQPKENALNHHCEEYELVTRGKGTAVVRRAGAFTIEIEFNQESNLKKVQQLKIYLNFGTRPLVNKGTQGILEINGKKLFDKNHEEWDHRVVSETGNKAIIEINIPHDVPVGVWMLNFEVKMKHDDNPSNRDVLRLKTLLYILFNPWSKHDEVYLQDEDKRKEYVLNDIGKIWVGGYPDARGREWVFGQFDDAVLPASILLMERSGINPEQRGDPVVVSRAISKMVNSNDDRGVIVGSWDGKYGDGTAPSRWTGSIKIMEEYMQKSAPVKYGQCWVFSGVTTTICRSLGIPARSVSNLNSAHDTNMSLTIDKYYDEDGKNEFEAGFGVYPAGKDDSIWNFHVWNDVWMARPDLPSGFGGWQAIDSTPQERSHGIYQCGPASLEAIRRGETNLNYDVNFVLAEVNADVVRWHRDEKEKDGFRKVNSDKKHVGRQLLTKRPGIVTGSDFFANDREDCTADYKAPEGTRAERVTLHAAVRRTRAARHAFRFPSVAEEDIEFALEDVERVPIGQEFAIGVKMKNKSDSKRTVSLVLSAASEYYTGAKAQSIKRAEGSFTLDGLESKTFRLKVGNHEYYDKLVEYSMIKLTAIANVKETTQTWIDEDIFQILKPTIKIEILGKGVVGKRLPVKLSFKNPLETTLRQCVIVIDGPGLTRPKTIQIKNVPPQELMEYELNVFPKRSGTKSLVATFNSIQLVDVTGSTSVDVTDV